MKKIIKKILYRLFSKEYKEIYKETEKYKYISFDIFDTLIKRNVEKPTDIFELIPQKYGKELKNFKEKRINAEHIARKQSKFEDVTLEEIYNVLEYPEEEKKKLINIEIELEKEYCTANKEMLELYNYLIKKNKKIYLTSDMYLSKEIIKEILNNNGFSNYEAIYLSSDKRVTKKTGNLFKSILKEEKISNNQLIHIGDNFIGDYFSPIKLNIKSVLIKTKVENTLFESKSNKTLEYNILSSFINNNIDYRADEYSKFGYEVLGPLLYGFTSWLHEKVKEDKIEKIYFLARDAKIIMDIYLIRYDEKIQTYYLNVSRKSVINSRLNEIKDFDTVFLNYKSILKGTSRIIDFFNTLDLNYKKYEQKLDINQNKYIKDLSNNEKNKIFNLIKQDLEDKFLVQNKNFRKYLNENNMNGKVAIVDVGWNGTIQHFIGEILGFKENIIGYYYGINSNPKYLEYKSDKRRGYLFDLENQNFNQTTIQLSSGLFEIMFLSSEGTTVSYIEKNRKIEPCLGKIEYSEKNIILINQMQNMAKQFVRDVKNSNLEKYIKELTPEDFFENYKQLANNPKKKHIKLFKDIEFENFKKGKLVDNKSFIYYVFKPKQLYIDFNNSNCKIMFMKSIFKIKFPYDKALRIIIEIYKKRSTKEKNDSI